MGFGALCFFPSKRLTTPDGKRALPRHLSAPKNSSLPPSRQHVQDFFCREEIFMISFSVAVARGDGPRWAWEKGLETGKSAAKIPSRSIPSRSSFVMGAESQSWVPVIPGGGRFQDTTRYMVQGFEKCFGHESGRALGECVRSLTAAGGSGRYQTPRSKKITRARNVFEAARQGPRAGCCEGPPEREKRWGGGVGARGPCRGRPGGWYPPGGSSVIGAPPRAFIRVRIPAGGRFHTPALAFLLHSKSLPSQGFARRNERL